MTDGVQGGSHDDQDLSPGDDVLVFPATLAQQRIWDAVAQEPNSPAYNLAVRFRLVGTLNRAALEQSFNEIVRRHETLRTTFAMRDGAPVQIVHPSLRLPLPVTDLRTVPEADRSTRAEALTLEEARRTFDLGKGPLLRTRLLQMADEEHILLVTVHQIACDCWSTGLITQEIGPLYDAYCQGKVSPHTELSIQYGDFAVWQKQWLAECSLEPELSFWKQRLADLTPLEIPTDRPRPPKKTWSSHIESVVLPKDVTNALQDYSHRAGCTFFMLSLAALKVLIHRETGQNDVYVGTITAGRTKVELEPLIGRFINPLVVRCDLSGSPSFDDFLSQVHDRVLEALEYREVPYELVLDALAPKPDPSRHSLFQINFVHQRAFLRPLEVSGITMTPIPSKSAGSIYDLYFFMVERKEGWRFSCEYNTDLYDATTISRLLAEFQTILHGIAANPSQPITRLTRTGAATPKVPRFHVPPALIAGTSSKKPPTIPQDDTERRLLKVWQNVLGDRVTSTTADFFDEGGHSVLAARLLSQVEREFGKKVSFAMLLRAPNIRALATRLRDGETSVRREQVHEIQPRGTRTPLFIVTSQPPMYRPLSHRLGLDQPTLGLTVPELRALPDHFTIADVAANLIEAMREVQPHGPYYLGGWCVSGILVYEMAQQLRAHDERMSMLAIFDAQCPPYSKRLSAIRTNYPAKLYFKGEKLLHWLKKSWRVGPRAAAGLGWEKMRGAQNSWRRKLAAWLHPDMREPLADDLGRLVNQLHAAVTAYEPQPYDSPMVLFRSRELQSGRYRDPNLGWAEFAQGGLDVTETPGEHGDMFLEPTVEILANKLVMYLTDSAPSQSAMEKTLHLAHR